MLKRIEKGQHRPMSIWLYAGFVLLTSFFTYMYRYDFPAHPFWDEPYHIASAQKYLNGVYFMEQHPPLGKLLIAAGEKIVNGNQRDDQFITTDYATNIPPDFSFLGYRFFPSLLAWLTAPLLFFIFLFITGSSPLAALLSFLYIFDNAQIVHSRGAMVDSTLTFFGMAMVLVFLHLQKSRDDPRIPRHCLLSLLFGLCFGLAMTTKLVGLIFLLLVPALLIRLSVNRRNVLLLILMALVGFVVAYVAVWQIHFSLGSRVVPELPDQGYYQASPEYRTILNAGKKNSVWSFPLMLRDSLKFVGHYNNGVPRLDLCKPDENGSPSYFWPFGARSINYRWEQAGEGVYRYLYLQSNPVGWGLSFLGVLLSVLLLLVPLLFTVKEKLRHPFLLLTFLGLFIGYMAAISWLDRVMYLYHYFLPLLFSEILFALVLVNIQRLGRIVITLDRRLLMMIVLGFLIFVAFQFYRPLTYYEPLSDAAFKRRAIFPLWELKCVQCEKKSGLVVPVSPK